MEHFSLQHFALLKRWQKQKRDGMSPEQNQAYDVLKQVYGVTEDWARRVQQRLFPDGEVKLKKRPTNQGNAFMPYQWAKIYPTSSAPKLLAYTVGFDASDRFVVKLDTVAIPEKSPMRARYWELRGRDDHHAPFVAVLTAEEGCAMTMGELVDWTVEAIERFEYTYDELATQLGVGGGKMKSSVLDHFRGHPSFARHEKSWSPEVVGLMIRLAEVVHRAGLDWWYIKMTNKQLIFGRKAPDSLKGKQIGGVFLKATRPQLKWVNSSSPVNEAEYQELTDAAIDSLETFLKASQQWPAGITPLGDRDACWPDDYDDLDDEASHDTDALGPTWNHIYYGPPGTGKTYGLRGLIEEYYVDEDGSKRYEFVTFHQSYGYEEFVEGIRPVMGEGEDDGQVRYEVRDGVFKQLCERARQDEENWYAIIIDEINRGNISKIFGELITLLEVDKREGHPNAQSVRLPYSGQEFSVPWNVDVIGTMNTADRSLALIDTALRRRFDFVPMMPDLEVLAGLEIREKDQVIDVPRMLEMINRRIEALYDRDHTIGHAYFTGLEGVDEEDQFEELQGIFEHKVIPLLEEYFFEDWQKIRLVLGDNQKADRRHQFIHVSNPAEDLSALFGHGHDLDPYAVRPSYCLNPKALKHPQAYIGIYATGPAPASIAGAIPVELR